MNKAILLWGYPRAGKTTIAKRFVARYPHYTLFDDPKKTNDILAAGESGSSVIITDPFLCLPEVREDARSRLAHAFDTIRFYHINTPYEVCLARAEREPKRKTTQLIHYLYARHTRNLQ